MTATFPVPGRCGACAQPAHQFPSGRWGHGELRPDGTVRPIRPCRARTQTVWAVDDAAMVRCTHRFIPDGEPLPAVSNGWRAWMRGEDESAAPPPCRRYPHCEVRGSCRWPACDEPPDDGAS